MAVITTSTKIADVIVPEIFTPYTIEKTAEKSKILASGIATQNEKINQLVTQGGATMNMPFWQDLTGEDEVLNDNRALTPGKIGASKDVAVLLMRGRAWGANDLAGALAGDDPMDAIANRVADYWARREQKTLVAMLTGVFASASMSNHILDKSSEQGDAAKINGSMVLDGKQLLGDAADQLQAMLMHSAVFTKLQKDNLIEYVSTVGPDKSAITLPTYLGYNIIVDDGMPVTGTGANAVYTTYLFAKGVIARGEGVPVDFVPTETDRDSLAGEDYLINRKAFVLHMFGVKWIGQPTEGEQSPTNADLALGTNWQRVYEDKNIGVVAIKHKI